MQHNSGSCFSATITGSVFPLHLQCLEAGQVCVFAAGRQRSCTSMLRNSNPRTNSSNISSNDYMYDSPVRYEKQVECSDIIYSFILWYHTTLTQFYSTLTVLLSVITHALVIIPILNHLSVLDIWSWKNKQTKKKNLNCCVVFSNQDWKTGYLYISRRNIQATITRLWLFQI